jgi:hypothetical protein
LVVPGFISTPGSNNNTRGRNLVGLEEIDVSNIIDIIFVSHSDDEDKPPPEFFL